MTPISPETLAAAAPYWWVGGLINAFFLAGIVMVNSHYRVDGTAIIFIRSLVVSIVLWPVALAVGLPTSPMFWAATIGAGVLATVGDSLVMNSASRYGAGVTSRLLPMSPLAGFLFWFVVHPEKLAELLARPWVALGVLGALVGGVVALACLRSNAVTRAAMFYLAPIVLLYGLNDVLNKTAQDHAPAGQGGLVYIWLISVTVTVCAALLLLGRGRMTKTITLNKKVYKAGLWLGALYILAMLGRNTAMTLAINPAYASIIGSSAPLWVYAWHRWKGIPDSASPIAGFAFVASAALLILFASL
jgi:hypothetical protein